MKYLRILVIGVAISGLILFYAGIIIPPFGEKIGKILLTPFFDHIADVIEKAELENQEKIENGEDTPLPIGRDTCYQWEDTYEIGRYGYENKKVLEVHKGGPFAYVLQRVTDYSVYENKLFVISYEGYAVIDKNKKCRVLITAPAKDFEEEKEYGINAYGEKMFYSGKTANEYITYIEDFDEYSEREREILSKMLKGTRG